jgi:acetylornithine deacetylase/succinyl-diaminopimelate desuccinylase-like protein
MRRAQRTRLAACLGVLMCVIGLSAQTDPGSVARRWRMQHERAILDEFTAFLSLPNVTADRDGIERNAAALAEMMRRRGMTPRMLSVPGSNPVVFGELITPGATTTVVFYAHYDGQPVEPKEWAAPPFSPILKSRALDLGGKTVTLPPAGQALDPETRIYARSAADDKGQILALLTALDAVKAAGLPLRANLKFVFDGEEERGSESLERIVSVNRNLLSGTVWLICDGSQYPGNRPVVTFGARGFVGADITVYGARRELHSGNFGNWAPNPALALARLLASLKDDNGRILIDGFYDGIVPLSAAELTALRDVPPTERELMQDLLLGATEGAPATLNERLVLPSMNIRGLASARVGAQAASIIPSTATASIDMRIVKGMDHRQTARLLIEHARRQGFFVVDGEPTTEDLRTHPRVVGIRFGNGGNAFRTSMDLPIAQAVIRAIEAVRGPVIKLPTMGGSLPVGFIEGALSTHLINIHMSNPDSNNHSANENLRLQNLWDGIEQAAALLLLDARP